MRPLRRVQGEAMAPGEHHWGVQLIGAAETLHAVFGIVLSPVARTALAPDLDRAHATLGEQTFATAWATGRRLSLEQAIEQIVHQELFPLKNKPDMVW